MKHNKEYPILKIKTPQKQENELIININETVKFEQFDKIDTKDDGSWLISPYSTDENFCNVSVELNQYDYNWAIGRHNGILLLIPTKK